jgi:type III secretion HrpO family protein
MNDAYVLDYSVNALILVLKLSMPAIVVAASVGVLVGLLQSLTQLQDTTLAFAIKLIAVSITLAVTMRWMGEQLLIYANRLMESFPAMLN